mmetsp:Transcript_156218/g.271806  ORF Transcript_156218/g.271806 Transcript_156218/m.271806 type:complete len:290 (-) Transcript_156218:152-1021(-)
MPLGRSATMRETSYVAIVNKDAEPQHGHCIEYLMEVLGILISIMYIVGCYFFESEDPLVYEIGDWLFLVACVISCVIGVFEIMEKLQHSSYADEVLMTQVKSLHHDERDEVLESVMFLISHFLFTWGCVYFLPEVTQRFQRSDSWGAWLCITGSFGLCFAVFYTTLTFSSDPAVLKMLHNLEPSASRMARQLKKIQMSLLLVGAILFTVGSFMYRPVFAGECQQGSTNATCMAVQEYGTTCYLWGSYIFLVASLIGTYVAYLKHSSQKHDDGSGKALGAGSNALMYNTV